jgi:hypothetical protein
VCDREAPRQLTALHPAAWSEPDAVLSALHLAIRSEPGASLAAVLPPPRPLERYIERAAREAAHFPVAMMELKRAVAGEAPRQLTALRPAAWSGPDAVLAALHLAKRSEPGASLAAGLPSPWPLERAHFPVAVMESK